MPLAQISWIELSWFPSQVKLQNGFYGYQDSLVETVYSLYLAVDELASLPL